MPSSQMPSIRSGVWQKPPAFADGDAELTLVSFFDWAPLTYTDLRYAQVLIGSSGKHTELAGHYALVEVYTIRRSWLDPQLTPAETQPSARADSAAS